MIRSRSPEGGPVLLLRGGNLGRCAERLLAEEGVPALVLPVDAPTFSVDGAAAVLLAADRPYPRVAEAIDDVCWQRGVPWIQAYALAHELVVGPAVIPGRTPCYACWARRVRSLAPDVAVHDAVTRLASEPGERSWFRGELAALNEQIAAMAVAEALSLRAGERRPRARRLGQWWDGNALSDVLRSRQFARLGRCARCAPGEQADMTFRALADHFRRHPVSPRTPPLTLAEKDSSDEHAAR
ncbi:hypothetical protein SOCE26_092160 [Sorangium cellulosum]|uniref:THIF-type NAD/FAD binding fold domain-containing protein n=1 Tax=Sorangium cellulosum TaxID=56 RepID=A0A2L0F848_SORCE|nr:TOMM precursor leader peptide-binding protein [Sorangium cellulosum]AUX47692.1 hypothetical protein SOCE26_092160 [Sorangium cellulosum]